MTVTQYIGAPYIPHGWTTWQPATAYDGMSVVEYNLVWYIAKQPVPIGTAPTGQSDDPYWAAVDRWNGQVEEYRKYVEELKNFVYNSDFGQLWINRKVVMITDSYGININSNAIRNNLGVKEENFIYKAQVGALFTKPNGDYPWPTYLETLQAIQFNTFEKSEVTDIIICGGYNDCANTYDNVRNGMFLFMKEATTQFPKAMVKVIHWAFSDVLTKKTQIYNISYRAYSEAGNFKNMEYIPGAETILHDNNFLQDDGYHPNANGALRLQNFVPAVLKGSSKINYPYERIKIVAVPNVSLQNSFNFAINGLNAFYAIDLRITFTNNLPKNQTTAIANLPTGSLMQSNRIFVRANAGSSSYAGYLVVTEDQLLFNIFDNDYKGDLKDFYIIPISGYMNAYFC